MITPVEILNDKIAELFDTIDSLNEQLDKVQPLNPIARRAAIGADLISFIQATQDRLDRIRNTPVMVISREAGERYTRWLDNAGLELVELRVRVLMTCLNVPESRARQMADPAKGDYYLNRLGRS